MSAFEEGASIGSRIVQQGFDQYWRAKQHQDIVSERAKAHEERMAGIKATSDYRQAELGYRAKTEADTADFRGKELSERQARDKAEAAHWAAMEKAAGIKAGRGGSGAGKEMTPAQAAAAAARIDSTFTRPKAPPMSKELFDQREDYRSLADPNYKRQTYQPPAQGFWARHNPFSSDSPTTATGSGLPGLE